MKKFSLIPIATAALVLLSSGCGALDSLFGDQKKIVVGPEGLEVCTPPRTPGVYESLSAESRPCTSGCPWGSYCAEDGNCRADCDATHLNCDSVNYCSCDGRCLALDPEPPQSTPPPIACPVDQTKVLAIISAPGCEADANCPLGNGCDLTSKECRPRPCEWDDQCPLGSHCSFEKGICAADCLEGSAEHGCEAGQACDCRGVCGGPSRPRRLSFELDVYPSSLFVANPEATTFERGVAVQVFAGDESLLTGDGDLRKTKASVSFVAAANLLVSCDGGANFASSCNLSGRDGTLTLRRSGLRWSTSISVTVKKAGPGPASAMPPEAWWVRVTSPEANGEPKIVGVTFTNPRSSDGATTVPVTTVESAERYTGVVTLTTPAQATSLPNGSREAPLRIPVEGALLPSCEFMDGPCLVLRDETSTLSRSGYLYLPVDGRFFRQDWLSSTPGGSKYGNTLAMNARIVSDNGQTTLRKFKLTGDLFGRVLLQVDDDFVPWGTDNIRSDDFMSWVRVIRQTASLSVSKRPDCQDSAECGGGLACEGGQCVQCGSTRSCPAANSCHAGFCTEDALYVESLKIDGISQVSTNAGAWIRYARIFQPKVDKVDLALCRDASNPDVSRGLDAVALLDGRTLRHSGDTPCAPSGSLPTEAWHGVDLAHHADQAKKPEDVQTTAQLLTTCLADLKRVDEITKGPNGLTPKDFDVLRIGRCFSPWHFFVAVGSSSCASLDSDQCDSLQVRLFQQWVQLHGFLASETFEQHRLASVDDGASSLPASSPKTPGIGVAAVLDQLDLIHAHRGQSAAS